MRNGELSERPTLAPRTSATGSSFWPTATATDSKSSARHSTTTGVMHSGTTLTDAIKRWPTPRSEDSESCGNHPGSTDSLTGAVRKWPTPTATPYGSSQNGICKDKPSGNTPSLDRMARSMWPTPRTITGGAESAERKKELGREESGGGDLQAAVKTWATPQARDWKSETRDVRQGHFPTLGRQVHQITKDGSDGSTAVVLSPLFVETLMGLPLRWTDFGVSETPSSRRRRAKPSESSEGDA